MNMYLNAQVTLLNDAIKYSNTLDQAVNLNFFRKVERFAKQEYATRVVTTVGAALNALAGTLTCTVRSVEELTASILCLNGTGIREGLKRSFLYLSAALVNIVCLPAIGVVGILCPKGSRRMALEIDNFLAKDKLIGRHINAPRIYDFDYPISARIFSPILGASNSVVLTADNVKTTAVSLLANFPITTNRVDIVGNDIVISPCTADPAFVNIVENFTNSLAKSVTSLFAGTTGVLSRSSRAYVGLRV